MDALAYTALFIGTALLALDTGLKQSDNLRQRTAWVTGTAWWGFAPFALVLLGGLILLVRTGQPAPVVSPTVATSSPPSIEPPKVSSAPSGAPKPTTTAGTIYEPFVMPRDLTKVIKDDLRSLAYQLDARLRVLVETLREEERRDEAATTSIGDKAKVRENADWYLNYTFRRLFEDNIKDLRAELKSRVELYGGSEPLWLPIPEKGLVDEGFILTVGDNLSALARQLPDY